MDPLALLQQLSVPLLLFLPPLVCCASPPPLSVFQLRVISRQMQLEGHFDSHRQQLVRFWCSQQWGQDTVHFVSLRRCQRACKAAAPFWGIQPDAASTAE